MWSKIRRRLLTERPTGYAVVSNHGEHMMASKDRTEPLGEQEEEWPESDLCVEFRDTLLSGYIERMPSELAMAFVLAGRLIQDLETICLSDHEPSSMDVEMFATDVESFLRHVHEGHKCLSTVEEDFGAVADGLAEYGGYVASSWHRLIVTMACSKAAEIMAMFSSTTEMEEELQHVACFSLFRIFDREAFLLVASDSGERAAEWLRPFGIELQKNTVRLFSHLEQEMFRAWKRKYPTCDSKCEALGDSREAQNLMALFTGRKKKKGRPCYERDRLWLTWHESGERLTHAKIRDRWNGMLQHERNEASPSCSETIGSGGSGTDVVKKGLKQALADRKKERESA